MYVRSCAGRTYETVNEKVLYYFVDNYDNYGDINEKILVNECSRYDEAGSLSEFLVKVSEFFDNGRRYVILLQQTG